MDEIIKTKDYAGEQKDITEDMLGNNKVYFLPYLMGERSPHNNPDARGTFIGMSMDTTREDMTLAVLEGVAFGLRDSVEVARKLGIKLERTKICGGGAKSPLWKIPREERPRGLLLGRHRGQAAAFRRRDRGDHGDRMLRLQVQPESYPLWLYPWTYR